MEDDHVDRRRVDVQQCMKLSLTNSPIDFIVLIENAHRSIDLLSSRANGAADGAPDDRRLGSAGCWCPAQGSRSCSPRPSPTVWQPCSTERRAAIQAGGRRQAFGGPSAASSRRLRYARQDKTKAMFRKSSFSTHSDLTVGTLPLIDLVVIAGWLHPFPFRTRP